MDLPRDAIGFHGTSAAAVPHLLARDIRRSEQYFEWLGTGLYLWQDSPWRARDWAEGRYGDEAAVVVARVDLDGCLDLLNPRWQAELRDADFEFVLDCVAQEQPIPVNTDSGNHARDAATINWYCERSAGRGKTIRSVRAIIEEGEPIFEDRGSEASPMSRSPSGTSPLSLRSRSLHGEARRSRRSVHGHRR